MEEKDLTTEEVVETTAEETVEESTEETAPDLFAKIREEYESKIAEMASKHKAEIEDRDAIIQQLITGSSANDTSAQPTFMEKLNAKREFKKW